MLLVALCLLQIHISNALKNNTRLTGLDLKTTNLKICNGKSAEWSDYPYIVSLYDNDDFCYCTGSILKKSNDGNIGVILTAAHCLYPTMRNGKVCVGCTYWDIDNGADGILFDIIHHEQHPEYGRFFGEDAYDVGKIYLNDSIPDSINGNETVEVEVCSNGEIPNMDQLRIQGYGDTQTPQKPDLQIGSTNFINYTQCVDIYNNNGYNDWILPSMTCMTNEGYDNADQTDCYGDSGSPVLQINTYVTIGIVSWGVDTGGNGCCPTDMPSVLTDLCYANITKWVNEY